MTDRDASFERVRAHFRAGADLRGEVARVCTDSIVRASELLAESFRQGGKLLLCGNGGSAADCQHVATELVARLRKGVERPGLPAIALTTDTSFLTAFANDIGFDGVFARQVRALGVAGDVLLAISTSGSSANVVRAAQAAKEMKIHTVALTGRTGALHALADVTIAVPGDDTQLIQEAHLAIEHVLCDLVERALFPAAVATADKSVIAT